MIDVSPAPPPRGRRSSPTSTASSARTALLAEIFRRIGTTNRQCFEVGGADGKWFSNSRRLIDDGWSAVLIEAEPANWPELDKLDAPRASTSSTARPSRSAPTRWTRSSRQCGFDPSMDLGVIDVDGQDYYLWNGMLKFQPRVMVVEYDPHADPNFVPDLERRRAGGARNAICSIAVSKGYFNAATTQTNADLRPQRPAREVPRGLGAGRRNR
jgi:hypothetical protein